MSWDLCILMAVALVLSSAMTSAESGMGTWLAMMISPIVMGVGQVAFIAILAIILIVLTNLANNIAVVFILINIVGALYTNGLPINMLATSLVLSIASCAVAYFTPASSLPGAILHGAEMTETKSLYVLNWIVAVYEFVLLMVVLIPVVVLGIGM
jgi:di/tricarboxylate transporter